jgi:hypothetical protein
MIKVNIKVKDDKYLKIKGVIHKRQVYLATGHTGARPRDSRCSGSTYPDRGLTQRRGSGGMRQWWSVMDGWEAQCSGRGAIASSGGGGGRWR